MVNAIQIPLHSSKIHDCFLETTMILITIYEGYLINDIINKINY